MSKKGKGKTHETLLLSCGRKRSASVSRLVAPVSYKRITREDLAFVNKSHVKDGKVSPARVVSPIRSAFLAETEPVSDSDSDTVISSKESEADLPVTITNRRRSPRLINVLSAESPLTIEIPSSSTLSVIGTAIKTAVHTVANDSSSSSEPLVLSPNSQAVNKRFQELSDICEEAIKSVSPKLTVKIVSPVSSTIQSTAASVIKVSSTCDTKPHSINNPSDNTTSDLINDSNMYGQQPSKGFVLPTRLAEKDANGANLTGAPMNGIMIDYAPTGEPMQAYTSTGRYTLMNTPLEPGCWCSSSVPPNYGKLHMVTITTPAGATRSYDITATVAHIHNNLQMPNVNTAYNKGVIKVAFRDVNGVRVPFMQFSWGEVQAKSQPIIGFEPGARLFVAVGTPLHDLTCVAIPIGDPNMDEWMIRVDNVYGLLTTCTQMMEKPGNSST